MQVVDLILTLPNNPAAKPWKQRDLSRLNWLVVHHAASMEDTTPEALNRAHHARGWYRLSYHYTIAPDGTISKINPATSITWTVANGNSGTLSVCLVGNREVSPCPPAQWESLVWLCKHLRDSYPTIQRLLGHKEAPTTPAQATACPGRHVDLKALRAAVEWREEEV